MANPANSGSLFVNVKTKFLTVSVKPENDQGSFEEDKEHLSAFY